MAISKKFIRQIAKIAGSGNIGREPEDLISYAYDGTSMGLAPPDLVVRPRNVEEIAAIVRKAAGAGVPVVARGAGTGLSGGALPKRGGIVLHFSRMNRLKKLDTENMIAVTEPGLINHDLKTAVAEAGLFYPPDPSSMRVCTLGGNVAENAGGPYGTKYGVTGDYVLGLEAVTSSGAVIRTGGITRRNVAGYDLTRLMVGSEGTLAVITEITLRLIPSPAARRVALFGFDSAVAAGQAVCAIGVRRLTPAAIEIMDSTAIHLVNQYRQGALPDAAAILLIEVDGEAEGVDMQLQMCGKLCEEEGGYLVRTAVDDKESQDLWEVRRSVSPALARSGATRIGEDISVPRSQVPAMIEKIAGIARRNGLTIAVFGHAGDGNLHPNILTDRKDPEMEKRTERAITELFEAAVALGGTISGEHGIGTAKAPWLKKAVDAETLAVMKSVKKALDPAGILNPGKIFQDFE